MGASRRWRYYDPILGRYLQSDPLGYGGSPVNLYAYAPNPLVQVDLFGLECDGSKDGDPPKEGDPNNNPGQEGTPAFKRKEDGAEPSPVDPAKLALARHRQAESVKIKEDKQVRGVVATDGTAHRENGVNTRDTPHSKVGREDPAHTMANAQSVGYPLPGSGRDVQRTTNGDYVGVKNKEPGNTPLPGSQAANHSEKQVAHDQRQSGRNEPIGVSDQQCGDCRKFHRAEAQKRQEQTVVADPDYTRVYNPGPPGGGPDSGTVDVYDPKGNYVGTAPPGAPPTGGTSGYKGDNPW